jgi:hypothetical protein
MSLFLILNFDLYYFEFRSEIFNNYLMENFLLFVLFDSFLNKISSIIKFCSFVYFLNILTYSRKKFLFNFLINNKYLKKRQSKFFSIKIIIKKLILKKKIQESIIIVADKRNI